MCVSEFMFTLSQEINVSEWLETVPQRLNPDGRVSTGKLTLMAQYLWTDTEVYNP